MKALLLIPVLGAFTVFCGAPQDKDQSAEQSLNVEAMKLKITVGDQVLTATMDDNPTTRDFISLLPVTTVLEDYASTEKIFHPDRKLSTEGAPDGFDPSLGDITYYAPWGNIAIFYKDFRYSGGLIGLGKIDGNGIEQLRKAGDTKVTFELMVE